jgi:hypothetical protein
MALSPHEIQPCQVAGGFTNPARILEDNGLYALIDSDRYRRGTVGGFEWEDVGESDKIVGMQVIVVDVVAPETEVGGGWKLATTINFGSTTSPVKWTDELPSDSAITSYVGGHTDLWGYPTGYLSGNSISDESFEIVFSGVPEEQYALIDHVKLVVWYLPDASATPSIKLGSGIVKITTGKILLI